MHRAVALRRSFLDWFEAAGYRGCAPFSLVPERDPTLLFVNAGMVPWKQCFLGLQTPPAPRVATVQRCVRAGGKHNDLDEVGHTVRHLTMFEMMGSFDFGSSDVGSGPDTATAVAVTQREHILPLAWRLLTDEWRLPPERLVVSVLRGDDATRDVWVRHVGVPSSRVVERGPLDNFWSLGQRAGPCGPCTEIHWQSDTAAEHRADADDNGLLEIWNVVLMDSVQQQEEGTLGPDELPAREPMARPCIDTGMGLERLAMVTQAAASVYDTDELAPVVSAVRAAARGAGHHLTEAERCAAERVVADHARTAAHMAVDGVVPGAVGRGHVLRRMIRRALVAAHGLGLAAEEPIVASGPVHEAVVAAMAAAHPDLAARAPVVATVLSAEEQGYAGSLRRGVRAVRRALARLPPGSEPLDAPTVHRLRSAAGVPLTVVDGMARAAGRQPTPLAGVDRLWAKSRAGARERRVEASDASPGPTSSTSLTTSTRFSNRLDEPRCRVVSVEWYDDGRTGEMVVDPVPVYGGGGGQPPDHGTIRRADGDGGVLARIVDARRDGDRTVLSVESNTVRSAENGGGVGECNSEVTEGADVRVVVDAERRAALSRAHTATHLVHAAVRRVVGSHCRQAGSQVDEDRLRLDVATGRALTEAEWAAVEADVATVVASDIPVTSEMRRYDDAVRQGAIALFGERYGADVRVVRVGDESVELCGGTHVRSSARVGPVVIVHESAIGAGTRRIEALVGPRAAAWTRDAVARLRGIEVELEGVHDRASAASVARELAGLRRAVVEASMEVTAARAQPCDARDKDDESGEEEVLVYDVPGNQVAVEVLRGAAERLRDRAPDRVASVVVVSGGRAVCRSRVGRAVDHLRRILAQRGSSTRRCGGRGDHAEGRIG